MASKTNFESLFQSFASILKKSHPEIATDQTLAVIKTAMIAAKIDQIGSQPSHHKKKLNGYNLYVQEQMLHLKEEDPNSNKLMSRIGEQWNQLTSEEKQIWKDKAKALPDPEPAQTQKKRKHHTSSDTDSTMTTSTSKRTAYQLYVQHQMPLLHELNDPKDKMRKIAQLWKQESPDQKSEFQRRATEYNQTLDTATVTTTATATSIA